MKIFKQKRSFTLIELLVVIVIVGVLAGLIFPAIGGVREQGRRITCLNNLRQHGIAWRMYLDDHGDLFPRFGGPSDDVTCGSFEFGGKVGSINPYDMESAGTRPLNRYLDVTDESAEIFHCPDDIKPLVNYGNKTIFDCHGNSYYANSAILDFVPSRRPLNTITNPHDKVFLEMCYYDIIPGHGGKGYDDFPNVPVMVLFVDGHVKGPYLYDREFDTTSTIGHPDRPVYYHTNMTENPFD